MNARMAGDAPDGGFGPVNSASTAACPACSWPACPAGRRCRRGGAALAVFRAAARASGKSRLMVSRDLAGPVLSEAELARMMAMLSDLDLDGLRIAIVQPRLERQRIDVLGAQLAMEQAAWPACSRTSRRR